MQPMFVLIFACLSEASRIVVPLQRQHVPVHGEDNMISHKAVYFGNIAIGWPLQQQFSMVFDTGSGHVVVPSTWCKSETCMMHNRYNRKASENAQDIDYDGTVVKPGEERDQITVAFGTGEITGLFVSDRLCLGASEDASEPRQGSERGNSSISSSAVAAPAEVEHLRTKELAESANCVQLRIVAATDMTRDPFHEFVFDGVLGLGLAALATAPEFSFFGQFASQKLLEQTFAVYLADSDEGQSEISFGDPSPDRLSSPLSWVQVAAPELGHWQVQLLGIRIGNRTMDFCADGQCRAVVDTGTSLLAVPSDFAALLTKDLSASLGGFDCRQGTGALLHFDLEGTGESPRVTTLTLSPSDYAREAWSNNSVQACRASVMAIDLPAPLGPKLFILGEPLLRKYYTVYDWQRQRIGFGLAKHPRKVAGTEAMNPSFTIVV